MNRSPRPGLRLLFAFAVFCSGSSAVSANAVSAEYAAGGLEFRTSKTIAMASEELYLSPTEVRVAYVFHSSASAGQHLMLAFPMPAKPVGGAVDQIAFDSATTHPRFARQPQVEAFNYMDFSARVNGVAMTPSGHGRALLGERDVTARLLRDSVPLVFEGGNDFSELANLPGGIRDHLVADGLLDEAFTPLWDYQAVFVWEQDFAPGDTRVEIAYQPSLGDRVDVNWDDFPDPDTARDYCIDAPLQRSARKRMPELATLGYVLTTAAGWAGPIGHFRLVVDKGSVDNMVAFCPLDSRKISPTRFEWRATDFVPVRDLKVLFFFGAPGEGTP